MKKKVFLGLLFVIVFFTTGGLYLSDSFNKITGTLQNIIALQQMDFSKKTFLNKVEAVQTDLLLKESPHALDVNTLMLHVQEMEQELRRCDDCHHAPQMQNRIDKLNQGIENYLHGLSRVYTLRGDKQRQRQELEETFNRGTRLVDEIRSIISASSKTVSEEATLATVSISNTKVILILMITAGPLLFIIASFLFLKSFTSSLSILTGATRKLASGDLDYRISEELKDEFGELAASFNEMGVSLKEQYIKLQETERLAVVGELAAGMAHEIKNPLAGIKVSIEVLSQDLELNQEDREIFLQIVNEIDRINGLLKSLLSYARPPKPESILFDVHQVLETTIKSARYSLISSSEEQEKKIEFITDFSPEVPNIKADPSQLQQVFLNLMLNAADAILDEGIITIHTRKSSDEAIEIGISDTGQGIDSQALEKIFRPFFTTKSQGTGLGLAICKRLIEQYNGGSITVANNQDGRGVTFTITLPIQTRYEVIEQ